MQKIKHRKGVSTILSVVILVGIAVVGGVLLFNVQNQVFNNTLSSLEARINNVNLEKDSTDNCYFSGTFYNSGSEDIIEIMVSITLDNGESESFSVPLSSPLGPTSSVDMSESFFRTFDICDNLSLEKSYSLQVEFTSHNNQSSALAVPVTIHEVPSI